MLAEDGLKMFRGTIRIIALGMIVAGVICMASCWDTGWVNAAIGITATAGGCFLGLATLEIFDEGLSGVPAFFRRHWHKRPTESVSLVHVGDESYYVKVKKGSRKNKVLVVSADDDNGINVFRQITSAVNGQDYDYILPDRDRSLVESRALVEQVIRETLGS